MSPLACRRLEKVGRRLMARSLENCCQASARGLRMSHRGFALPQLIFELRGLAHLPNVFTSRRRHGPRRRSLEDDRI